LLVRVASPAEMPRLRAEIGAHHWLGYRASGQVVCYVAELEGRWAACAVFGSAALSCAPRDALLGWDRQLRARRLPLVVANQRLCVLPGGRPHLASAFLGACLRRISGDYTHRWGHPVLAVEAFTDPARHVGTCYAAAGFTALGSTAGYARSRGEEQFSFHGRPKTYWLRTLHPAALPALAAAFDAPSTFPIATRPVIDINALPIGEGPDCLLGVLGGVLDARKPRGKRHELAAVLAVIVAATACDANGYKAITQWAAHQSQDALRRLGIRYNQRLGRYVPPSKQTIRRAARAVDPAELDTVVSAWLWRQARDGSITRPQARRLALALDGKVSRGAHDEHGNQLNLFSALVHGQRLTVAQQAIHAKTNEIPAFTDLLDQLTTDPDPTDPDPTDPDPTDPDPTGGGPTGGGPTGGGGPGGHNDSGTDPDEHSSPTGQRPASGALDVIATADALHTQRASAQYVVDRGGDYLFVAKDNQVKLADGINDLRWEQAPVAFEEPQTTAHGRTERRVLKVLPAPDTLPFPGAKHVFELHRQVTRVVPARLKQKKTKTGKPRQLTRSQKKRYRTITTRVLGVTSLDADQATPAELAALIRGHWQVEAHHHIRDVTFREDRSQIAARGAHAMATLRNLVTALFRLTNHHDIAHTRRDLAWDRTGMVLQLLGV
jgi:predicted transposase YbfD/YdcC